MLAHTHELKMTKGKGLSLVIFKNLTVNKEGNATITLTSQQYAAFLIDHQPTTSIRLKRQAAQNNL